eukprot:TRINITY_DN963_c0_g1_i5.p1 TRINITY_DN963_c0_g1~~TRINITY_DN963_c0_g1_i5.p1  ORF type:complete len:398 (-),score=88.14 TRINITY_DN963_c0_g1_i5:195-1388(-)
MLSRLVFTTPISRVLPSQTRHFSSGKIASAISQAKFYWGATKLVFKNKKQAKLLLHDLEVGNKDLSWEQRRFVRLAYNDFFRFWPFFGLAALPVVGYLAPILAAIFPEFLPSVYETPEAKSRRLDERYRLRQEKWEEARSYLNDMLTEYSRISFQQREFRLRFSRKNFLASRIFQLEEVKVRKVQDKAKNWVGVMRLQEDPGLAFIDDDHPKTLEHIEEENQQDKAIVRSTPLQLLQLRRGLTGEEMLQLQPFFFRLITWADHACLTDIFAERLADFYGFEPSEKRVKMRSQFDEHFIALKSDNLGLSDIDSLSHDQMVELCLERGLDFRQPDDILRQQLRNWVICFTSEATPMTFEMKLFAPLLLSPPPIDGKPAAPVSPPPAITPQPPSKNQKKK